MIASESNGEQFANAKLPRVASDVRNASGASRRSGSRRHSEGNTLSAVPLAPNSARLTVIKAKW
jgi:hypothetical protein